jgi:hypothetical protein
VPRRHSRNLTWNANKGTAGGGDAVYATSSAAPWPIRNSVFSNHPTAVNAAVFFSGTAPVLDYNTFWNNAGGNLAGASLGAHDVVANPLFVDAANSDVALGLHSPCLDYGDPSNAANDPDGSRNDRGAYGGPEALSRAPVPVTGLQAVRLGGPTRNVVSWTASPAPDVSFYAVYRGASASFVPSAANYLGQTPASTPTFTDNAGTATDWYRVAVIDLSGASSGFAPGVQPSPTDTGPALPRQYALYPNEPNPFNPSTILRFDLPEAAAVRLVIYDPAGRGRACSRARLPPRGNLERALGRP